MDREMAISKAEELVENMNSISPDIEASHYCINAIVESLTNQIDCISGVPDEAYIERCCIFREVVNVLERNDNWAPMRDKIISLYSEKTASDKELVEYPEEFEKVRTTIPFNPQIMLPKVLADYVEDTVKCRQVNAEMLALPCVSALSSCVQGKYNIGQKSYKTTLSLFTVTVAPPSQRKTSSIDAFTEPIENWINEENRKIKRTQEQLDIDIKVIEARIKKFERGTKNFTEQGYKNDLKALGEIKDKYPQPISHATTNVTTEGVIDLMADNHGKASIITDECGVFDVLSGLYNNGKSDIDPLLKGYDGKCISKRRAGGKETTINRAFLTICVMAQPEKFNKIKSVDSLSGRGFMERFMFSFPENYGVHKSPLKTPEPDKSITDAYTSMIQKLLKLPDPEKEVPVMYLNDKADILYDEYFDKIESMIHKKGGLFNKSDFAAAYGGKQATRALKLAGLFHLCEHSPEEPVDEDSMNKAILFSNWAVDQARAMLLDDSCSISDNRMESLIKKLLDKSKDKGKTIFTLKDIKSLARRLYENDKKVDFDSLREDLDELETRKFLLVQNAEERILYPKRAKTYKLNPFTESLYGNAK